MDLYWNHGEITVFKPHFIITPDIVNSLMKLQELKIEIDRLPINTQILASLKESAQLNSIHYSTMIEGNKLTEREVELIVKEGKKIKGKERDQWEVLGYYQALDEVQKLAHQKKPVTEAHLQKIHALVMGKGSKKVTPTAYRTVQNVIRDSASRAIVYLPPEAKDVSQLMKELIQWIQQNPENLPVPLIAAIAHYQYATIHPYVDGNGRTARLLTTLILHVNGYDLKGIYSLDEYYAKDLRDYYAALAIGSSHNYYMGRADADITSWIEYFIKGLLESFEKTFQHASESKFRGGTDQSSILRTLDARQRLVISSLFKNQMIVTSKDIEALLAIHPSSVRKLCQKWVQEDFLQIANASKKGRSYRLTAQYENLIDG